ncbi:MAG TPA: hypothetical protein VMV29_08425 [Ktedonobacterales bacterium]|nr:hypothetical protein [Ktedonobacterales bacterium]
MTRALTPTPQRATITTTARRESESPTTRPVAPATPTTSSPTTLAQETALVANRLHANAGRLALLTLRIMREDLPRQLHSSTAAPALSAVPAALPSRIKPRRSKLPTSQSTSLATPAAFDSLATLEAIAVRLRPLIRRTDELMIAHDGIAVLLRDPAPEGARIVTRRLRDALDDRAGSTGSASAPAYEGARYVHLLLGIGYVTFDATGAVVSNDDPCAESEENACDERPHSDTLSARFSASADAAPDATFGAWFARLFMRAWESYTEAPITISLVDAPATGADLATAAHVASAEPSGAQQELALRRQATRLGVPFARLPTLLPSVCRRAISRELASELRAIPIGYAHATLTVAMEHPCDAQAVSRLRQATGHTIFPVLGAADEISRAITQLRP